MEESATTRELKSAVEEARRVGLRSWKSRKCARWLVPNWPSKPSAVCSRAGVAMMPALLIRMLSFWLLDRKSLAQARTLARELRSRVRSSTRPGERMSARAAEPLAGLRTQQ